MNVLILTVAFLFMFVGGIFVGRELTYLADKRKRKPKVHHKHPPVAAGRLDDKSKHWPADWVPTPQEMDICIFKHPETGLWHHNTEDDAGSVMGWADPDVAKEAYVAYVRLFTLNERGGR
tara:strand:- start:230 stop:589 length:360 start_codon:yes stop_codon:yes gene_type:complete